MMPDQSTHESLKDRIGKLEKELESHRQACGDLKNRAFLLDLQAQGAATLNEFSQIIEGRYQSLEKTLQEITDYLSESWPFPGSVGVRIVMGEQSYRGKVFFETDRNIKGHIAVGSGQIGTLEVFLENPIEKPDDDTIYLREATALVNSMSDRLSVYIERRRAEELLEEFQDKMELQLLSANDELKKEIDSRKQVENSLRESESKYRIVLDAAPDPVAVYDLKGRITYINPAFTHIFGWTLEESVGRKLDFMPEEFTAENDLINQKIVRCERFSGVETRRTAKSGREIDVSISGAFFYDGKGRAVGSILTLQDLTERKKTREEITFLAYNDPITLLKNRNSFYLQLEDRIRQSKRRTENEIWALLFLDLDKFKYINETLGHDAGDQLLKTTAQRLKDCLRETDYIFRLGGDEFTVILTNISRELDAAEVAIKIRETVARSCKIKGHDIYTTVSIGISLYPHDGTTVEELVKNADMAMYVAKEEGEGYRFFTEEMNRKAMERMRMGNNLRKALKEDQFLIHYQPMVNKWNLIVGMEALIRWQHPKLGLVLPSRFIPLAEEIGTIIPIGEWVLRTSCRQAMRWHDKGFHNLYISVNLSTRQFREKGLVEMVEQVLMETRLPPRDLKLEVTESGIMDNPEEAILKMERLRKMGIRFSIDDFGTGYSSLSYMKRFPIDTLKIDRSFISDSMTNHGDQEIIKTIISMAQNLKVETVAEGVETEAQQQFLCLHGCHMMQGYYFGKPMPPVEFEHALRTNNELLRGKYFKP